MSWSITAEGRPAEVVEKLQAYGASLTGQSKVEFDDALPHLVGLVNQNHVAADVTDMVLPHLRIAAYGSGSTRGAKEVCRSCAVDLKTVPPPAAA